MADDPIKISALGKIQALAAMDFFPIVDESATAPADKTKYADLAQLLAWLQSNLDFPDEVTLPDDVSQAEAEAGTETANRTWSPLRVAQAIEELAGGASLPDDVSQAEAEAGTETANRTWSPLRVAQAIAELGGGSGNVTNPAAGVDEIYLKNGSDIHEITLTEIDGVVQLVVNQTPES